MIHLLKINEIKHTDVDGKVLWEKKNIPNIFHLQGELFVLSVAFNTGSEITVPTSYYLGLDARSTPQLNDTLSSLSAEPTQNGYIRQPVSSLNGFFLQVSTDGNYQAVSGVVTFSASGGNWGPVTNLFLATSASNTGYLISTAVLDSSRTVTNGQSLTMRISVELTN